MIWYLEVEMYNLLLLNPFWSISIHWIHMVYIGSFRSNMGSHYATVLHRGRMGLAIWTAWANGQFLMPSLPRLYLNKEKKKKKKGKTHTHIINCIYSLSRISFFLFLYLCLFSTQLIILEVQCNWIRNNWRLEVLN